MLSTHTISILKNIKKLNISLYTSKNNLFMEKLDNIYSKISKDILSYKTIKKKTLKKLHNIDEYSLIYIHYLESQKNNKLSFPEFYKYYLFNNNELLKFLEKKSRISHIIDNPPYERIQLNKNIYDNHFATLDIQHLSESHDLIYKEIHYKDHKLYIYTIKELSENKFKLDIDLIIFIIEFMENFFNNNKLKINLTLFLCNKKKKLNKNKPYKIITPSETNSGSTYSHESIFIWRCEEIYKVLIHELIHYFGFDEKILNYSIFNYKSLFCIKDEDRISEAITESLAVIIHTYIMSKKLNLSFIKLIKCEILFSLFQSKKLLNYFNINDLNDIIKEKNNCNIYFNQKTSAFSYFIIKTALIYNLENLQNMILNYMNNNEISLYIDLIKESFDDNFINIINSMNINDIDDEYLSNTLRMTCIEL